MVDSLENMREGCHPFIFYHRVRPFLSAWKHNPTLPLGVIYEVRYRSLLEVTLSVMCDTS